jgi:hypothetical protein
VPIAILPQWLSRLPSIFVTYRWTVLLSLALLVLLALWLNFIFHRRLSVLAGTVTVDRRSLPKFHLRVRQEENGRVVWECGKDFVDGWYAIHDVPLGALMLELSWGTGNNCRTGGTLTNAHRRTYVDFDIPLDVDVAATRNGTAGAVRAEVKCTFKAPISDPPLAASVSSTIKYTYVVTHMDTQPPAGTATGPLTDPPQEWIGPDTGNWQSVFTTVTYNAPHAPESWSVEVSVDGAPEIKKKSKVLA